MVQKGDYANAERYAEVTYSNLRDIKNGIDQESDEVAEGAFNLADVYLHQRSNPNRDGDLIKAENLAREALRIRTRLHGLHHHNVGQSDLLLARILTEQKKYGGETKELFKRSLAIFRSEGGPDDLNFAATNASAGMYHFKLAVEDYDFDKVQTQLLLAESYFKVASRIETKMRGPTHKNAVFDANFLAEISGLLLRMSTESSF